MKNYFLLLTFLFLIHQQAIAQPIGWYWAKSATGNYDNYGNGITTDVFGNVYVAGNYGGTTISFGTTTLSNSGGGGMYIVKYDATGNVLWAKTQGGAGGAVAMGVSTDALGNVFVTGGFSGSSVTFGPYALNCAGINDLFIVKFDQNGSVLWAKSAGGTASEYGRSISIDNNGNAFVTGYFKSPSLTIGTYTLSNTGQNNVLVVKYDPNGTVLWAKAAGGTTMAWNQGNSISADASGNALVSGYFSSASITFGTYTLTNAGTNDLFIVKFDSNGNILWAKSAGGTMSDVGIAISSDLNGNVFLTGDFQSALIGFGTYTLANTNTLTANIFVTKYDPLGNVLWAKTLGSGGGYGICTNSTGSAFVTGYYTSASMVFGTATLISNGPADIYVVKYDGLGNELSSASTGGSLNDYGQGIAADGGGNVFVTGTYNSPSVMFGATILSNVDSIYTDVFVGKLGLCAGAPLSPTDVTAPGNKFICEVSSTTLSVTGTGIINWYSSPTSTLTLASGYSFVTPGLSVGNYTYYAEANTCTNSISRTVITVTVDACLGIANLTSPTSAVLVYPNPFQDKLLIINGELMIEKLSISNAVGEIILQQSNFNTSQTLDVSRLPAGIYFLKMQREKDQSVIKVVKE